MRTVLAIFPGPFFPNLKCDRAGNACDPDLDGDDVPNGFDNCPAEANATQSDFDHDGIGDRCDLDDGLVYLFPTATHELAWQAEPGATAVELLLGLAAKWAQQDGLGLMQALAVLTSGPQAVLGGALGTLQHSVGQISVGGAADLCLFDPNASWAVEPAALRSQGKHTPFEGHEMPVRVCATLVAGQVAYEAARAAA